jgi:Calcineurin-like phosphoesterase
MIAQLLNRQFVIEQVQSAQAQLEDDVRLKRTGGPGDASLGPSDYEEALAHTEAALKAETQRSSGQPGFIPPPPSRRGQEAADLDDFSFISRDPIINIVQSAVELYLDNATGDDQGKVVTEEPQDDQRRSTTDAPAVTDQSLEGYQASRAQPGRRIFDQFSITDARWVSSVVAMGVRQFRNRRTFNVNPPPPVQLRDTARVILVGDWASGIPRAQKIASAMRQFVDKGLSDKRDLHVMHLGDTYYAGWDYEYKKRFLPYWPVKESETDEIGSWSLNGNHDMYSGGYAYFDTLLRDPRFRRQGQASFFRLFNKSWQILGLDTAWDDNGLKDPQSDWVKETLTQNKQKTILLSHHQLYSAFEDGPDVGQVLREKLGSVLNRKSINTWFWGHEHRCVLYNPTAQVENARLIGHGGVPVYMTHGESDPYPSRVSYEDRGFIDKGFERWALFGFAVLDFDGPQIHVEYIDEDGEKRKEETLQ